MKNHKIVSYVFVIFCVIAPLMTFSYSYHKSGDDGEIRGIIKDRSTGQTIPGATISYFENGLLRGTSSDKNGIYKIKPLHPGRYALTFSFTGYQKIIMENVLVTGGSITFLDVELKNDNTLPEVEISVFREPLIRRDDMGGVTKISQEDIETGLATDIRDIVAQTANVYQKREGGSLNP